MGVSYSTMKCPCCKKKSHLTFTCRCLGMYCVSCRTPEVHKCAYVVMEPIALPKVVPIKVEKI
jgi:hypothetical protein